MVIALMDLFIAPDVKDRSSRYHFAKRAILPSIVVAGSLSRGLSDNYCDLV